MTRLNLLFVIGGALALALVALTVTAAPISQPASAVKNAAEETSMVDKVWGCHGFCAWGSVRGWHRHVGPRCRPVAC